MTQHKKKAHGVLPAGRQFQCDLCTKAPYSTKKSLKRHKLAVHGEAAAAGGNTAPKSKSNGKQKQSLYSGIIVSISSDDSDNDQKTTPHEVKKVKFSPKKSPGPKSSKPKPGPKSKKLGTEEGDAASQVRSPMLKSEIGPLKCQFCEYGELKFRKNHIF